MGLHSLLVGGMSPVAVRLVVQWPQAYGDDSRRRQFKFSHCIEGFCDVVLVSGRIFILYFRCIDILEGRLFDTADGQEILLHCDEVIEMFPDEENELQNA
jgi:hypothetical protein